MTLVRSIVFAILFYLWWTIYALAMLPMLAAPRRWWIGPTRFQARVVTGLLRYVCDIEVEFRGREHLTSGAVLVAAKHQCMFDTIGPLVLFPDAAYVMRDSLLRIPFYGWIAVKTGMIPIDRQGKASALRSMVAAARACAAEGRQIVIFPEGTRLPPGAEGQYKPGVAALYRALDLPCTPMATNSGVHWPPHGLVRRPGRIVYQLLESIPPGLDRREFMRRLEEETESASAALLAE